MASTIVTAPFVTATANVSAANLVASQGVFATANVSGANLVASQQVLAANVVASTIVTAPFVTATGNVSAANLVASQSVVATANVSGANLVASQSVIATANVSAANVVASRHVIGANLVASTIVTAPLVSVTGNVTAANLVASQSVIASGNISGAYVFGNAAFMTGISGGGTVSGNLAVAGNVYMAVAATSGNSGVVFTSAGYSGPLVEKRTSATDKWGIAAQSDVTRVYAQGTSTAGRVSVGFPTNDTTYFDVLSVARNGSSVTSGNVGINTTTPTQQLHVVGNARVEGEVYATGDITAFSDATLKTDLRLVSNVLERIARLTGYTFDRLDLPGKRYAGVLAQDVLGALPEAVQVVDDKLTVSHGSLSALYVEALKDLAARVEDLGRRVGALELQCR